MKCERMRYNNRVATLHKDEYPILKGLTYLDHAGMALPSRTLIDTFAQQMKLLLLANTHSTSTSLPSSSQIIKEQVLLVVLELFNASPKHFDVVSVANATAGIKLVREVFAGDEQGFDYYYHKDSHTSLVGVRELAKRGQCLRSNKETEDWLRDDK